MTEQEWLASTEPLVMLEVVRGSAGERKLRLYAAACCYGAGQWLADERSREAVEAAEKLADECISPRDLHYAQSRAWRAAAEASARLMEPGDESAHIPIHAVAVATHLVLGEITGETVIPIARNAEEAINFGGQAPRGESVLAFLLRDVFGNPFRPVTFSPEWRTETAVAIARGMYESRDFSAMPILADALQDAGCDNDEILDHCRGPGPHVRGCWVVDLVLGKG